MSFPINKLFTDLDRWTLTTGKFLETQNLQIIPIRYGINIVYNEIFVGNKQSPLTIWVNTYNTENGLCFDYIQRTCFSTDIDFGKLNLKYIETKCEQDIWSVNICYNVLYKLDKHADNEDKKDIVIMMTKLRHEALVALCSTKLSVPYLVERKFSDAFPEFLENGSNKTPDIISKENQIICECGFSTAAGSYKEAKRVKYEPIILNLNRLFNLNIKLVVVTVLPSLRNLTSSLEDLNSNVNIDLNEYAKVINKIQSYLDSNTWIVGDIVNSKKEKNMDLNNTLNDLKQKDFILNHEAMTFQFKAEQIENSYSYYNDVEKDSIDTRKHVPSHASIKSIIEVREKMNHHIASSYKELTKLSPSFHLLLDPTFFKYQNDREEALALLEFSNLVSESKDPAFEFVRNLKSVAKNVSDNNHFKNIFETGYPDLESKVTFNSFKKTRKGEVVADSHLTNFIQTSLETYNVELELYKKELLTLTHDIDIIEKELQIQNISDEITKFISNFTIENGYCKVTKRALMARVVGFDYNKWPSRHHKSLHMNIPSETSAAKDFYKKSGINAKRLLNDKRNIGEMSSSCKIDTVYIDDFKNFFDSISQSTEDKTFKPDYLLSSDEIVDHPVIKKIKSEIHKIMNPILETLLKTKAAQMAWRYALFAEEMIHLGAFENRKNDYYIVNTGILNIQCCIAGTHHKRDADPGVPFFFFGHLNKNERFSKVFGEIYYDDLSHQTEFVSSWRRLKMEKLAHASDVFYTTISCALKNFETGLPLEINPIQEFYIARVLTGLSCSQKVGEMLADFKYIVSGAFSIYSKADELLFDKMKPPYNKHITVFLFSKFIESSKNIIRVMLKKNKIIMHELNISDNSNDSEIQGGGVFRLPYLWSKGMHTNFENFIDSMLLYTMTDKEPASMHHESIKSLNTILKFNEIYENLSEFEKWGIHDKISFQQMLSKNQMGFEHSFLRESVNHMINKLGLDLNKIACDSEFFKRLGEFSSTKAVIETPDRDPDQYNRLKVHDALIRNSQQGTLNLDDNLYDHAIKTLKSFKAPIADMCIKSQFGPKREFYVLDLHSKFLVKFLETFFKILCKHTQTECITVPGDKKLYKIKDLFNVTHKHSKKLGREHFFVNGDCSKWSASEMLESFAVMVSCFKDKIPKITYDILMGTLCLWQKKELQIPNSIRKLLKFGEKSMYLFKNADSQNEKVYRIPLKQNFLMGLMNYTSSFKASCINEYSKYKIESEYLNVKLFHLEHSDDYAWGIACRTSQLGPIKTNLSINMRMGSITDSDKKTIVTNFAIEFVSLYCFNGVLIYPIIKKIKEVGSNWTGLGYVADALTVPSRVGEAIRVGSTTASALMMMKVANWRLQMKYSTMRGQRNETYSNINPANIPVECFGVSECLPNLILCSFGDPNNYRLSRFNKNCNKIFNMLMRDNNIESSNEGITMLKSANFAKNLYSKRFDNIKKILNIDTEAGQEFWKNNKGYEFCKPKHDGILEDYLKAFYAKASFKLAYCRMSKLSHILRTSAMASKSCIRETDTDYFMTMKEYSDNLLKKYGEESNLNVNPIYLNNGSDVPELIYNMLEMEDFRIFKNMRTSINKNVDTIPLSEQTNMFEAPASLLIQYLFDKPNFILDNRFVNPLIDLELESQKLKSIGDSLINIKEEDKPRLLFNIVSSRQKSSIVGLTTNRKFNNASGYFFNNLEKNLSYMLGCKIEIKKMQKEIINPYIFNHKNISSYRAHCLTVCTLFFFYLTKGSKERVLQKIQHMFSKLKFGNGDTIFEFIQKSNLIDYQRNSLTDTEISNMLILKTTLCYDTSGLNQFFSNESMVSYRYENVGNKDENGKYYGFTKVKFVAYSTKCCAYSYRNQSEEKGNLLLTVSCNDRIRALGCLNVALRLTQKQYFKTDSVFKQTKRLKESAVTPEDYQNLLLQYFGNNYKKILRNSSVLLLINDRFQLRTFESVNFRLENKNKIFLPIILAFDILIDTRDLINLEQSNSIKFNTTTLALEVGLGWVIAKFAPNGLETYDNLIVNQDDYEICGIKLTYLLRNRNLHNMFYDPMEANNTDLGLMFENLKGSQLEDTELIKLEEFSKYIDFKNTEIETFKSIQPIKSNINQSIEIDEQERKTTEIKGIGFVYSDDYLKKLTLGMFTPKVMQMIGDVQAQVDEALKDDDVDDDKTELIFTDAVQKEVKEKTIVVNEDFDTSLNASQVLVMHQRVLDKKRMLSEGAKNTTIGKDLLLEKKSLQDDLKIVEKEKRRLKNLGNELKNKKMKEMIAESFKIQEKSSIESANEFTRLTKDLIEKDVKKYLEETNLKELQNEKTKLKNDIIDIDNRIEDLNFELKREIRDLEDRRDELYMRYFRSKNQQFEVLSSDLEQNISITKYNQILLAHEKIEEILSYSNNPNFDKILNYKQIVEINKTLGISDEEIDMYFSPLAINTMSKKLQEVKEKCDELGIYSTMMKLKKKGQPYKYQVAFHSFPKEHQQQIYDNVDSKDYNEYNELYEKQNDIVLDYHNYLIVLKDMPILRCLIIKENMRSEFDDDFVLLKEKIELAKNKIIEGPERFSLEELNNKIKGHVDDIEITVEDKIVNKETIEIRRYKQEDENLARYSYNKLMKTNENMLDIIIDLLIRTSSQNYLTSKTLIALLYIIFHKCHNENKNITNVEKALLNRMFNSLEKYPIEDRPETLTPGKNTGFMTLMHLSKIQIALYKEMLYKDDDEKAKITKKATSGNMFVMERAHSILVYNPIKDFNQTKMDNFVKELSESQIGPGFFNPKHYLFTLFDIILKKTIFIEESDDNFDDLK